MEFTAGIIGFGKLGITLGEALAGQKKLIWIVDNYNKAIWRAKQKCRDVPTLKFINEIQKVPDYIFLTVYDSVIESTAQELASHFGEKLKGCNVIHCSGALTTSILQSCKDVGAKISSMHPYQTFYFPSEELLNGIQWSVQSEESEEELVRIIEMLGGEAGILPDDERTTSLYHCSAVVASNFLNALLSFACDIAREAGIDPIKFIPPIVRTTVDNNLRSLNDENDFPLTGPFARADLNVIEKHLDALKDNDNLLKAYCYLGLATIKKAQMHRLQDNEIITKMEGLLKEKL